MIKKYAHDDPELLDYIKHLLGSDEWHQEHRQALRRQRGKVFYLLFDKDSNFVSMCSVYKNQMLDGHTLKQYRNNGYMQQVLLYALSDNTGKIYAGTANPAIEHILKKLGFKYKLNRGRYCYYEIYRGNDCCERV